MKTGNMIEGRIESNKGFYIGDICYVLSKEVYHGFWGKQNGYEEGVYQNVKNGFGFAVDRTAYGDGCYEDDDGYEYPVDAGVIGVVPLELCERDDMVEKDLNILGRVVEGTIADFYAEDGVFEIEIGRTVVEINTRDYGEDEDEEYY